MESTVGPKPKCTCLFVGPTHSPHQTCSLLLTSAVTSWELAVICPCLLVSENAPFVSSLIFQPPKSVIVSALYCEVKSSLQRFLFQGNCVPAESPSATKGILALLFGMSLVAQITTKQPSPFTSHQYMLQLKLYKHVQSRCNCLYAALLVSNT